MNTAPDWRSSTTGSLFRDREHELRDDLTATLGYMFAGPLATGYTQWIRDVCDYHGIERIFFMARDGWLPWKMYPSFDPQRTTGYLQISRAVILRASLANPTEQTFSRLISGSKASLSNYFDRLDISSPELLEAAMQWFGGDIIVDARETREKLSEFFEEHYHLLADTGTSELENLRQYLQSQGVFEQPEKSAIVDVGWSGELLRF